MTADRPVYIGTDGGATTSKVGAVWEDGSPVSTQLLQRPTRSQEGPEAVVASWAATVAEFLELQGLHWAQVRGVGLAIPGPFRSYGVWDHSANLPDNFAGFDVHTAYMGALSQAPGGRCR